MKRKAIHHSILLLSIAPIAGCGAYLGPNLMAPLSGDKVVAGASAGYQLYVSGSRGMTFTGDASVAPGEGSGRPARGFASTTIGYGFMPLPDLTHVGFEFGVGPALGVLPEPGGNPFSTGWVFEVGVPYRVTPTERPWELGAHLQDFALVVPELHVEQVIPVGMGYEHVVETTFVFSLAFRLDQWLAVEP